VGLKNEIFRHKATAVIVNAGYANCARSLYTALGTKVHIIAIVRREE
jgi:hypothetical protein